MRILIVLLFTFFTTYSQQVTLDVSQDLKLATIGDDKGNNAFTPDIRLRVNLEDDKGIFVAPEFEYADLKIKYIRYSVNAGYNYKLNDKIRLSSSLGYGLIDRDGISYSGFSGDVFVNLKLNQSFFVFLNSQIVQRKDVKDKNFVFSNYIGIRYNLINI